MEPNYLYCYDPVSNQVHRNTCKAIKNGNERIIKYPNLSTALGFQSYNEACREGYKPCRKCKPTSKHDLKMSIPIYSKVRKGETLIDLEKLCHKESYYYLHYNNIFIIQTSNGKWRIHIDTMPIKVEHINTKKYPHEIEFHRQPRIFLSLSDVFFYIKRHDNCLK